MKFCIYNWLANSFEPLSSWLTKHVKHVDLLTNKQPIQPKVLSARGFHQLDVAESPAAQKTHILQILELDELDTILSVYHTFPEEVPGEWISPVETWINLPLNI